ncbi:long-chain fatty acid--CoA ligase [Chitinivorax sp. B]|uniref:acyl-CoA synthetase n=1 Tax=Chitinivorax sp. B TaxID=2502235 RepID=UPI0014850020|nr:long-chain fatty acid--CoA ligase [Chitinivorax sp. B]
MLAVTPLGEWLDYWRQRAPTRVAIVDVATGKRWQYGQLADACDLLTTALRLQRVAAGDRIALLAVNRVETLLLLFACARLRALLVPLNTRLTTEELNALLADAEPALLLHDAEHAVLAGNLTGAICTLSLDQLQQHVEPAQLNLPVSDGEQPVLMLYTSGTTGQPKGALLSQRMVLWNALNTTISWDLSGADCAIAHTPFFHTGGLNVLTTPLLLRGGKLVLLPNFEPKQVLKQIALEQVTILFAVPTMFQRLLDTEGFHRVSMQSLRFCISGGAPCPIELIDAYQQRGLVFRLGYGLTEAGPNCFTLSAQDAVRKRGAVGFPNFATRMQIVDCDGKIVEQGEVGELWLSGPTVCSGYWRNPAATQALFHDDWLKTGDLVRQDEEGYTWVIDRKKDMYISGGENVYPAEVEAALLRHASIAEAAVIGCSDTQWGEVGVAYLVLKPGQVWDEGIVRTHLNMHLARYKQPKSFVLQDSLPRTPTGKVQKAKLRKV